MVDVEKLRQLLHRQVVLHAAITVYAKSMNEANVIKLSDEMMMVQGKIAPAGGHSVSHLWHATPTQQRNNRNNQNDTNNAQLCTYKTRG